MLTHAIVTKVFKSDKNKDGTPFKTKTGKPYWKVAIKTDKTGEDWYSCLVFSQEDREYRLEEGTEDLFKFETNNGFKNFKLPSKLDLVEGKVDELLKRVLNLENVTKVSPPVPTDFNEVNPEDVPF